MGDAEIRADLRLQLDKLGADTAKAAKMINKDLASSVKGLGETSVERDQRLADDRASRARRERAIRNRKLDEADERKEERRKAAQENSMRYDRAMFERQMMAGMLPMFRPFSPWGTFFAGRQSFQAFSGTKTGQNMMGQFGLSGNGGAAIATASFVAGATAIGIAVLAFREAVANFRRSVEQARVMYAATLHSGYGLQTGYKLQTAGRVIGVDPNTVWQFGAAFAQVATRLKEATEILSQTNPVLTKTSWEFGILETDIQAFWASVSEKFAPSAQEFIGWIDKIVKSLTPGAYSPHMTRFSEFAQKELGMFAMTSHAGATGRLYEAIKSEGGQGAMLKKQHEGGIFDVLNNSSASQRSRWFKQAGLNADDATWFLDMAKKWKNFIPSSTAPTPNAYMRQLPASRWEHMGLIVGGGGGTNYPRQTAEHTKKAATYLSQLVQMIHRTHENNMKYGFHGLPSWANNTP